MEKIATRDGYGKALLEQGRKNKDIVALDADLSESTKSIYFAKEFPERFFQMGISEQNMIGTAAGLAAYGKIPFASSFCIFLERGFEQIRTTIARQNLNVKIVGSHGGLLTGEDGSSAQALEDISIMRSLPNMVVIFPADAVETEKAVEALVIHKGASYLRLGRGKVPVLFDKNYNFEIGKGVLMKEGEDVALISTGSMLSEALKAAEELSKEKISARVIHIHTIKPIDKEIIIKAAKETKGIVTVEDHSIIGGLGSSVAEFLSESYPKKIIKVGVKDTFGESGSADELYRKYGLTSEEIIKSAKLAIK